ncbi:MAG: hypothetical protein CMG69_02630 [Candidatus Marinimicrobia bacterium]|nr:hypothetical protein [Candidatus Neomarinimicrobiota bacterium]|tara:strand:- start:544 stop:1419 length:876 start_codon:yes stop_codon:yes gene_type:complete
MTSNVPSTKYGWLIALIFFICFLLFNGLFHLVLYIFGQSMMFSVLRIVDEHAFYSLREWVTIALTNPFVTLFWIWIFHKIINKRSFSSLGLKIDGYKNDFMEGLFLGFGLVVLGIGSLYFFDFLSVKDIKLSLNHQLLYIFIFAVVSIAEETAIRGFILQNLSSSFNKYIALILSSLAFVVIRAHVGIWGFQLSRVTVEPVVSLNLFLFGILLGLYCIHRKNLWFPIGLNFSWSYLSKPVCNLWDWGIGRQIFYHDLSANDYNGSILVTSLTISAILFVHKRYSGSESFKK